MKGLTDYQKFKLVRPLPDDWIKDERGVPFIKKDNFDGVDWEHVKFTTLSNRNTIQDKRNAIPLLFHYDFLLDRIWNNPLKYVADFSEFLAVLSPDFSAYRNMEPWLIEMSIDKSLWLAATLQSCHIKVIPTITWADERTYNICFDHFPKGDVVAISTIGIGKEIPAFLQGFNEMKSRLKPSLIIVRGNPIRGMSGRFLFIGFEDTFNVPDSGQMKLFEISRIQEI
jgi:hypothetical protein